ncbi:transglutaminase domain-containing protein [Planosporangium thailandense]|uniref:Transglutaminase domain-containing protein n=1 Tax=Planosporangium thailandense TaxID=765197 RepID=A0ABX0XWX0_9ACTN|nr:transglutaminase domain-containing protein [Planosporangium thailandense]
MRGLAVPAALVGMLGVAGLAFGRLYSDPLAARLFVGAAAGAVTVSVAARRLPSATVAPLSVLGLAGYTLLAVRLTAAASHLGGPLSRLTVDALANGVPRVLTAMIPIEPQPDTVGVPVVATWLAGLAGGELALRGRRTLLACLPPGLLYASVLYVVGPNAERVLWQPLCFAGFAAVALAVSARNGNDDAVPELTGAQRAALRVRVAAGTAAGLAGTLALVAVVAPPVAHGVGRHPADPRRYVTPPQQDILDESPLVRLSGWALGPDQRLFDVRLSGGAGGETRIRLAVLSDYDGVTWRVGATYRPAGRVLAGPRATGDRTAPVTQRITIDELDGRLVPAAAVPERIDGARVSFDQASGTIAIPEGLRPGLGYTVVSRAPKIDVNLLPSAGAPSGPTVARFMRVGSDAPKEMQQLGQKLAEGNPTPYARAQAIEQFLAEHYRLVSDAPSGHAYPNLTFFLFGPPGGGGQRGTSEQFAAAFAVLGRLVGLPTRVVVGFRVRPGSPTVRGADALAWPEVLFDGVGWVAFNPLPQPDTRPRPVEDDFKPRPEQSTPPPSTAPPPSVAPSSAAPSRSASAAAVAAGPPVGTLVAVTGIFGVPVLCVALIVLLRRSQRRRRLYEGDPPGRVLGAWREVLDALRLAGRPPPPHLAPTEVADHAARVVAAPPGLRPAAPDLAELAGLVNAVAFAPCSVPPGGSFPGGSSPGGSFPGGSSPGGVPPGGVEPAQAELAAAQATAYIADLRARRPWWRWLLWSADPRPVWWARRNHR